MTLPALNEPIVWIPLLAAAWLAFAALGPRLLNNVRGDIETGVVVLLMKIYVRLVHRLRVRGLENVPASRRPGPIIVVANHTSGVDPLLMQAAVPFEIRFMMARDMQPRLFRRLWDWTGVISVDRDTAGGDTRAAREAIRYLTSFPTPAEAPSQPTSGVIGIFPEGGIERPQGRIMPFLPGVGLLVHKSGARVLPVLIEGAPDHPRAWGSLYTRSRARVTFFPIIDYASTPLRAGEIATDLHDRFVAWSGRPANDKPSIKAIRG